MSRSNALRFPVTSPRGRVYLTGLQWSLWWLLTRPRGTWRSRELTLTRLSSMTGSSRGRCWHAIARLRSLELVGWRAWPVMELDPERRPRRFSPGRNGRILVWIPRGTRDARRASLRAVARDGAIDSVSSAYGAWITREGLEAAWRRRSRGAGAPARAARGGSADPGGRYGPDPRPRRGPPRVVWARCPAGHRLRAGRLSWRQGPEWAPFLEATYGARCPRCAAGVLEVARVDLAPPPPRGMTAAELADPALFAARIDSARRELEARRLHPALREQLRRDYTERPPGYTGTWPTPAIARFGDLAAATIGGAGRASGGEGRDPSALGGYSKGNDDRTDDQPGNIGRPAAPLGDAPGEHVRGDEGPLGSPQPGRAGSGARQDAQPGPQAETAGE